MNGFWHILRCSRLRKIAVRAGDAAFLIAYAPAGRATCAACSFHALVWHTYSHDVGVHRLTRQGPDDALDPDRLLARQRDPLQHRLGHARHYRSAPPQRAEHGGVRIAGARAALRSCGQEACRGASFNAVYKASPLDEARPGSARVRRVKELLARVRAFSEDPDASEEDASVTVAVPRATAASDGPEARRCGRFVAPTRGHRSRAAMREDDATRRRRVRGATRTSRSTRTPWRVGEWGRRSVADAKRDMRKLSEMI